MLDATEVLNTFIRPQFQPIMPLGVDRAWPVRKPEPELSMSTEKTYGSIFERLWLANSREDVSSSRPEHAAEVIRVFLDRAERRVAIFCRNLDPKVYDRPEVVEALRGAMTRHHFSIEVVVQESAAADSEFYRMLKMRTNCDDSEPIVELNGEGPIAAIKMNFAIADDRGLRFEPDNGSMNAVAFAYAPELVGDFDGLFAMLKSARTPHAIVS